MNRPGKTLLVALGFALETLYLTALNSYGVVLNLLNGAVLGAAPILFAIALSLERRALSRVLTLLAITLLLIVTGSLILI